MCYYIYLYFVYVCPLRLVANLRCFKIVFLTPNSFLFWGFLAVCSFNISAFVRDTLELMNASWCFQKKRQNLMDDFARISLFV